MEKHFPNGFPSWSETHFQIVSAIAVELQKDNISSKAISLRIDAQGSCGMYELAEELTNKFEITNKGRVWDGDWLDAIEEFLKKELS